MNFRGIRSSADGHAFGFFREQDEQSDDGDGGSDTREAENTQHSHGVAALRGRVIAAVEQDEVAEGSDVVRTGLDDREAHIARLKPDIRRVSSGRSGITERLTDLLSAKSQFFDVLYLEGRHGLRQTPEQYIGAWHSVNDLQVQLGPELFGKFLDFIEQRTAGLTAIETTYVTRAWAARRT